MKVQGFRIGNFVRLNKEWYDEHPTLRNTPKTILIDDISKEHLADHIYYVAGYDPDYLEPITITERWLAKLGFKKKKNHFYDSAGDIRIEKSGKKGIFWLSMQYSILQGNDHGKTQWNIISLIKHVHQLQNLYSSLTNNELKTK